MTPSDPPHNPYASPMADATADEADPQVAYERLAHKRQQQATATVASWIAGGLLTCGAYTWFLFDIWTVQALLIMGLANLVGIGWVILGVVAGFGSARAHGVGLVWSYLAAAFFLTHCNLLAALVVALIISQGHRLRTFDRQLLDLALDAQQAS